MALLALLLGTDCVATAQQTADPVLDSRISLGQPFVGEADSLLSIVKAKSGLVVAYSSRVFVPGQVRMPLASPSLRQCLDVIFWRLPVSYVVWPGKVVVSAADVKMVSISGFCRDAQTGEALLGAHVADTLLRRVVAANDNGYFCINVPSGRVPLRCSYVGYASHLQMLDVHSDTAIVVRLQPRALLSEVRVDVPDRLSVDEMRTGMLDIPIPQVVAVPTLLGESDLIGVLQQTPGVSGGSEGFGGMSVRGGSTDQNMVFLDDAPLYNPNHALGLFSAFCTSDVSRALLFKGGFPSRYGGRMSSVLDIHLKDGDMARHSGLANIGILASNISFSGPIARDKASFLFSARRSYFDQISNVLRGNREDAYAYHFYDVTGKVRLAPSASDKVSVTLFTSRDVLSNRLNHRDVDIPYGDSNSRRITVADKNKADWGSVLAAVRWGHIFGSRLFANTTAWLSNYKFTSDGTTGSVRSERVTSGYSNGILDVGIRSDFNFYPDQSPSVFRLGALANYKCYKPIVSVGSESDSTSVNENIKQDARLNRFEFRLYAEDEFRLGSLFAIAGVHLAALGREGMSPYLSAEPRLLAGWNPDAPVLLKLGLSQTSQFVYLLRMMSIATPADLWMPVPTGQKPARATQANVEIVWDASPDICVSAEAYVKSYKRQLTYRSLSPYELLASKDWDAACTEGRGYAQGVELFVHKLHGRTQGWLGYALSMSRNKFQEVNDGNFFPSDNDRRHTINAMLTFALSDRVDVSSQWKFATGAPLTLPSQRYEVGSLYGTFVVPPMRNSLRLPSSSLLNLGVDVKFGEERNGATLSFGVYNATAKRNPMFVYWRQNDEGNYQLKKFCMVAFPWPYVKYTIRF